MTPAQQLDTFIDKYTPETAAEGRAALRKLRKHRAALNRADEPVNPKARRKLVIRSISAKQRPRRRAGG